ncbi:hypothetical protein AGMMS50256_33800 [Betaproteobacteria bacterium]|nr:hypothetical protein AGMMS50256_33800 [Betaproteobacteria bacterium]
MYAKSPMRNKSIRRNKLHQEFDELLQKLQSDERLLDFFQLNLQRLINESGKDKDLIVN